MPAGAKFVKRPAEIWVTHLTKWRRYVLAVSTSLRRGAVSKVMGWTAVHRTRLELWSLDSQ
jgi:hypothetical protein